MNLLKHVLKTFVKSQQVNLFSAGFIHMKPQCDGDGGGGAHATHVTVGRTTSPPLRSQGSHHLRVSRAISRKIRQLSSIARPVRLSDVI